MRRLVEFAVPGGGTLLAEVDEPEGVGPRPAGVGGGIIQRATMGLDEAIAKVRPRHRADRGSFPGRGRLALAGQP
jgi:hypothetical protein